MKVDGNTLTFFPDGPERLDALVALIDGAKTSLRLLYYIYDPDKAGERVRKAVVRAVDRGVAVSLLIDGFGSSDTPDDYFAALPKKARASAGSTRPTGGVTFFGTTRSWRLPMPKRRRRAS